MRDCLSYATGPQLVAAFSRYVMGFAFTVTLFVYVAASATMHCEAVLEPIAADLLREPVS